MADQPTLTREAVRELDRRAIEEVGVPSVVLMESAGRACADEAERMLFGRPGETLVLCGPGNNGGDGLVIARTLMNRGHAARVVFVGPHEKLETGTDDFRINLELWRRQGGAVDVVVAPGEVAALADELADAPLVVDALFGTGLARELGPPWDRVVAATSAEGGAVLAVDIPSGLDANTGEVLGVAVRADTTVTFVAAKPGLLTGDGPDHAGRVVVAEIGIPRFLVDEALGS
ncbi:MAG: NAD(P)H-hydrate epimerase [Planctomycetota bacterium]